MTDILVARDIYKSYGSYMALKGIHFQLKKGEVHALMGENGAGKSTFIKVITGVVPYNQGTLLLEDTEIYPKNSLETRAMGISAVYQHPTSFPDLSVVENIFMGQEILTKFGLYNYRKMVRQAKKYLEPFAPDIDVKKTMSSLSVAQQQMVEIAKALSHQAKIIIFDEPTASLTKHECEELYQIIDKLKEKGVSIIFVTHRFEDMYHLADRVTILRDGEYIDTCDVKQISESELIQKMVGHKVTQLYPIKTAKIGSEILRVEHLTKKALFKDISFSVRQGEILALTGLVGAGRTEVCQALFGIMCPDEGKIFLNNKEIHIKSPVDALKNKIALLPEDRQLQGLICTMPIYQNVSSCDLKKYVKMGVLSKKKEKTTATRLCNQLNLKAESIQSLAQSLSGGNQQKVVLAKLLNCDLKVLIVDEPTKGIDVGAKQSVYEIMSNLASEGYAIIMVSSDMPEVLGMADRIVVMKSGRITAQMDICDATQEKILSASLMDAQKVKRVQHEK